MKNNYSDVKGYRVDFKTNSLLSKPSSKKAENRKLLILADV